MTFDPKEGVPRLASFRGTVSVQANPKPLRIDGAWACRLLEGDDRHGR